MAQARTSLRSIEGTRGIAALSILAYHTALLSNGHGYLEAATSRFWLGVPLFFALSGFLLYRPFARSVIHEQPRPSVVRYARHRVLRIVPAFWLVVSVSIFQVPGLFELYPAAIAAGALALWAYIYLRRPPAAYLAAAAALAATWFAVYRLAEYPLNDVAWRAFVNYFLINIPFAPNTGIVGPAWSLCIEVSFYLFLPVLAFAAARYAAKATTRDGRAMRLSMVIATVLPVGIAYLWISHAGTQGVSLPAYIDEFAVGMLLAIALERWPLISARSSRSLLLVAVGIAIVANIGYRIGPADPYGNGSGIFFPRLMVVAFALALASVLMRDERTLLGRALSARFLVAAGTISYGIYLWHFLLIERLSTTPLWWSEGTNLILVLALTFAVATTSWLVLERPLLRAKDDLASLRRVRETVGGTGQALARPAPLGLAANVVPER
jgi:peptidoglycan/LPS O-acetylase OafA/YrhL